METKVCITCLKEKSIEEYHRDRDQTINECKQCRNAYLRDRKKKKKEGTWNPTRKHRSFPKEDTPKAMASPTTRNLEWIAGFLEGEGSFGKTQYSVRVSANQKTRGPLDKLQKFLGGSISYRDKYNIYQWETYGARAYGIMMTLYSLLSSRRQKQILEALSKYRAED